MKMIKLINDFLFLEKDNDIELLYNLLNSINEYPISIINNKIIFNKDIFHKYKLSKCNDSDIFNEKLNELIQQFKNYIIKLKQENIDIDYIISDKFIKDYEIINKPITNKSDYRLITLHFILQQTKYNDLLKLYFES